MLDRAYDIGKRQALAEFEKLSSSEMEKEAFFAALKGIYQGSKALRTLGWLAGFGGRTSQFVGMPLGSGLIGAATAEPGDRLKGFATGVAGGLGGAALGAAASKALPAITRAVGSRIGNTGIGKKIWSGAGKINSQYGANSLPKYRKMVEEMRAKHMADPSKAGEMFKPPPPPTVNVNHSFGQHALTKVPGAIGVGGMLGGFTYGTSMGESAASDMYDASGFGRGIGSISQRNIFNPAG
jgi:hypothetical protein